MNAFTLDLLAELRARPPKDLARPQRTKRPKKRDADWYLAELTTLGTLLRDDDLLHRAMRFFAIHDEDALIADYNSRFDDNGMCIGWSYDMVMCLCDVETDEHAAWAAAYQMAIDDHELHWVNPIDYTEHEVEAWVNQTMQPLQLQLLGV